MAYLFGQLVTATMGIVMFPLLSHPAVRQSWAEWHRHRAGHLLDRRIATQRIGLGRYLCWLSLHATLGLGTGLAALLCIGNAVLAAVITLLWWAFPVSNGPPTLMDIPITGWCVALAVGPSMTGALIVAGLLILPALASGYARLSLALLVPSQAQQFANRVAVLTRSRADALEAHGAELRRIERDLHDGTQARLVAIAMRLAVARRQLADDPETAARMLCEAHDLTEEAMTELREVIRGVYPPILADRGLPGALRTVASRGGVPVEVDIGELDRLPAAVEAVAYFAVAEALTNVAKHSRATRANVRVRCLGKRLTITVSDNGVGGAHEAGGSGLAGIRYRAQAFDGTVAVCSPAGGPTALIVVLPCG